MKKIVVAQPLDLYPEHIERLKKLGDLTMYDTMPETYDKWLERVKDADIICSGKFGLKQKWQELENVFISLPFVGVGWIDIKQAKEKNIVFSKSPGCNKEPVAEWIIGMMINLFRNLPKRINSKNVDTTSAKSLAGKTVCIVGAGNVGQMVGNICDSLHMDVVYYRKGDNIFEKIKDADVVVDVIALNKETEGMYNEKFFQSLKKGAYFITVTSDKLWNVDAMLKALDDGILKGVANDCGGIQVDDTRAPLYEKLRKHPKILATAHTAYNTDRRSLICYNMMIDNIEAWIKGKPINLVE